jgi:hypothetical protein
MLAVTNNKPLAIGLVLIAFCIGLIFAPLAAIVLVVQWGLRRINERYPSSPQLPMGLVLAAGMVANLVVLPVGLFWGWVCGKELGPPPGYGE